VTPLTARSRRTNGSPQAQRHSRRSGDRTECAGRMKSSTRSGPPRTSYPHGGPIPRGRQSQVRCRSAARQGTPPRQVGWWNPLPGHGGATLKKGRNGDVEVQDFAGCDGPRGSPSPRPMGITGTLANRHAQQPAHDGVGWQEAFHKTSWSAGRVAAPVVAVIPTGGSGENRRGGGGSGTTRASWCSGICAGLSLPTGATPVYHSRRCARATSSAPNHS